MGPVSEESPDHRAANCPWGHLAALPSSSPSGSLRRGLLSPTRFPTAGPRTGAGAPGRVRLNRWTKIGTQISIVAGLSALAAYLEGGTTMVASAAVNLAVAIGVAVGGRVGDSSRPAHALVLRSGPECLTVR
jgi:hypothetical protein